MAANTKPIFILTGLNVTANTQIGNTIVPADTTAKKTVITGATDGTLVYDLVAVSDDTVARSLVIYLNDGTNDWPIGTVSVADGATSASLLNVIDIPSLDKRDDGALILANGQSLKVASTVAVTALKTIWITAVGGNY